MRISRKQAREIGRKLGVDLEALAPKVAPAVRLPGDPAVSVTSPRPGVWRLRFEGWRPASKNDKVRRRSRWIKARKRDDRVVALAAGAVPAAAGFRTVRFWVEGRGNLPDPQNMVESLADALKAAGLIVDDSSEWSHVQTPLVRRGKADVTVVEVADTEPPAWGGG